MQPHHHEPDGASCAAPPIIDPLTPSSTKATPPRLAEIERVLRGVVDVLPGVEALYRDLHEHPELSGQEARTSQQVAERLQAAGFEVVDQIGGFGVAGVLHNGAGPVIAIRGDMDALPILEATNLPYASRAYGTNREGREVPVMHACGHDVHTACLLGAAELLSRHRDRWTGTLLVIAQPAEETVAGARAMIEDRLYQRTVTPEVVLGQHVMHGPAGAVVHRAGTIMAGARSIRIEIAGRGGHGSQPQLAIDPIVIAAAVVDRLQTIVSRELGPFAPAVVTVGQFHAGSRPNVIPECAVLELTARYFTRGVGDQVLAAITRIVRAECAAGRSPTDPKIDVIEDANVLVNDAAARARVQALHEALFDDVFTAPAPTTGSEDFGELARAPEGPPIPIVYWMLGGTGPDRWNKLDGEIVQRLLSIPANHSPQFYPDLEPTLQRGVEALASAALAYLVS